MNEKEMDQLFLNAKRHKPDEAVWLRIKSDIQNQPAAAVKPQLADLITHFVQSLKPVGLAFGLALLVIIGVVVRANVGSSNEPYVAYLMDEDAYALSETGDDVTDGINTYFL
jgi:hypothetical protein